MVNEENNGDLVVLIFIYFKMCDNIERYCVEKSWDGVYFWDFIFCLICRLNDFGMVCFLLGFD